MSVEVLPRFRQPDQGGDTFYARGPINEEDEDFDSAEEQDICRSLVAGEEPALDDDFIA